MGGQDRGSAFGLQAQDELPKVPSRPRVKARRGFVKNHNLEVINEGGHGQSETLALPDRPTTPSCLKVPDFRH